MLLLGRSQDPGEFSLRIPCSHIFSFQILYAQSHNIIISLQYYNYDDYRPLMYAPACFTQLLVGISLKLESLCLRSRPLESRDLLVT